MGKNETDYWEVGAIQEEETWESNVRSEWEEAGKVDQSLAMQPVHGTKQIPTLLVFAVFFTRWLLILTKLYKKISLRVFS